MLQAQACRLLPHIVMRCESAAAATYATAAEKGKKEAGSSAVVTVGTDWKAVQLPEKVKESIPTITVTPGQAYPGDLRSTSGLGMGDGLKTHTDKWLEGTTKSPMEYINAAEPILVEGAVVASYGSDDPALGCPVEYISLKGTSKDNPAVCKYTGNKYYSNTWRHAH